MSKKQRLFDNQGRYTDLGNEVEIEAARAGQQLFKKFAHADVRDLGHLIIRTVLEIECEEMLKNVNPTHGILPWKRTKESDPR